MQVSLPDEILKIILEYAIERVVHRALILSRTCFKFYSICSTLFLWDFEWNRVRWRLSSIDKELYGLSKNLKRLNETTIGTCKASYISYKKKVKEDEDLELQEERRNQELTDITSRFNVINKDEFTFIQLLLLVLFIILFSLSNDDTIDRHSGYIFIPLIVLLIWIAYQATIAFITRALIITDGWEVGVPSGYMTYIISNTNFIARVMLALFYLDFILATIFLAIYRTSLTFSSMPFFIAASLASLLFVLLLACAEHQTEQKGLYFHMSIVYSCWTIFIFLFGLRFSEVISCKWTFTFIPLYCSLLFTAVDLISIMKLSSNRDLFVVIILVNLPAYASLLSALLYNLYFEEILHTRHILMMLPVIIFWIFFLIVIFFSYSKPLYRKLPCFSPKPPFRLEDDD